MTLTEGPATTQELDGRFALASPGRAAIEPDGRLLFVEMVVPPGDASRSRPRCSTW
jgi:hypothetical protein